MSARLLPATVAVTELGGLATAGEFAGSSLGSPARFLFTFHGFPFTISSMNIPAPALLRRFMQPFGILPALLFLAVLRPAAAAEADAPAKPAVRIVVLTGA